MRFLCDAMLGNFGRYLRMAGYDTIIDSGENTDFQLVLQAKAEGRWLLTRDEKIREIRASREILFYLPSGTEENWAYQLRSHLGVDWMMAPFSRCLQCNSELIPLPEQFLHFIPMEIQPRTGRLCPHCQKPYWAGTHVLRMREKLQRFQLHTVKNKSL